MNSTTKIARKTLKDKDGNFMGAVTMKWEKDFSGYDANEFKNITMEQLFQFLLICKVKEGVKAIEYMKTLKKMDKTEMIYKAMETKISFDGVEAPRVSDVEREMVNHIRKNY